MPSKSIILLIAAALLVEGCGNRHKKADDPLADSGRTQRTENLLVNLATQADSAGYLFGHEDATMYGIGWMGDSARSDVKSVCNDYPALMGFDLGHIELGHAENLDGVSFAKMRRDIIAYFARGAVITLSWHPDNPIINGQSTWVQPDSLTPAECATVASVIDGGAAHEKYVAWIDSVAAFLNSLETPYGVKVPVIFRPYHEHNGSWFWWGQRLCTAEQYKQLWKMTADRLREQGVTNALFAYSPGGDVDGDAEKYMERYPGDDIVDIFGLDQYCFAPTGDTTAINAFAAQLDRNLDLVCRLAKEHHKVAALTETGFEAVRSDRWWTQTLQPVLDRHAVAYVLLWRNAHDKPNHFFVPYPGQRSVSDFVRFYNAPRSLFLRDVNGLYLKR